MDKNITIFYQKRTFKGILNFINDDKHSVGQGMITYASEPPQFKSIWSTVQNRICTVADSFRVTEDLGKIRGQFQLLHKPIFGMKGMAIPPVMEFSREGYKIRKVFG